MSAVASTVSALPSRPHTRRARWFFPLSAIGLIVCALVGFHFFYFQGRSYPGRDIPPPIRGVIVSHGLLMTAWLGLFLIQPLLIALRKHKLHMALGKVGAVLAAGVVASGVVTAIAATRLMPPEAMIWGMTPLQFFAVPFLTVFFFAACVAGAIGQRKRPERHRALMLMGTLAASSAAIARMDALNNLYIGTAWETWFGPFLFTIVAGALLVVLRAAWSRRLEPSMILAWVLMTGFFIGVTRLAVTPAWEAFAAMLVT
jgi:hypothetical protein